MTKVTLLTINSPHELTGGGHYLRSLIHGYSSISNNFNVIGKCENKENADISDGVINYFLFKKKFVSDFFSRLLLSPSFLLYYLFKIKDIVADSDVIAIHSSRLGIFSLIFRLFFRDKIIVVHYDNVESNLIKERLKVKPGLVKAIVLLVDLIMIYLSEFLSKRFSTHQTFITNLDGYFFNIKKPTILPICFQMPSREISFSKDELVNRYILFTGSFDFEPNILALHDLFRIAKKCHQLSFIVAGRELKRFENHSPDNIKMIDSPSEQEMSELFTNAEFYLSPVSVGSGMKTKIAEAMKFSLPIVAHKHSLIGYEDIQGKEYLVEYQNIEEIIRSLNDLDFRNISRSEILSDFKKFYTYETIEFKLKKLLGLQ